MEDVESKLPPKVAATIKVPMSPWQSAIYDWVKATGTLRLDPAAPVIGKLRREYASLNNKCMELRKVSESQHVYVSHRKNHAARGGDLSAAWSEGSDPSLSCCHRHPHHLYGPRPLPAGVQPPQPELPA